MSRKVAQVVFRRSQEMGPRSEVWSVGHSEGKIMDPFLLLAEMKGPSQGFGFPDHPHRGFETATYMFEGQFHHEDFLGNNGVIGPGDLQWMTAGRGVLHSEMPKGEGHLHGIQLWINLSAKEKMVAPNYQEVPSKDIPEVNKDGVKVRIIAGESLGAKSKVYTRTPSIFLDFKLMPNAKLVQDVPEGWTAFTYIINNEVCLGPDLEVGKPHHTVVFTDGSHIEAVNKGSEECHFLLIAGTPLNEPVVQQGPFVMNTADEIKQAALDYKTGKNGFENATTWRSEFI